MNRLVLIGNGFDLAHGLKTSYCDFIRSYLSDALKEFVKEDFYEDPLLSIESKVTFSFDKLAANHRDCFDFFKWLQEHKYAEVRFKSKLLEDTIHQTALLNWVDIESEYYKNLLACRRTSGFDSKLLDTLNSQFDYLRDTFESYLISTCNATTIEAHSSYTTLFTEDFSIADFVEADLVPNSMRPEKLLLLNFNYTSTVEYYNESCEAFSSTIMNSIHGSLADIENPIIFGFGDEHDASYVEFEGLKNNELFTHIKSFKYLRSEKYHNLLRFIRADNFQAYIMGHSCGISDRTMLKQIFEHENCKSIKIFYHLKNDGKNDFTEKTFDISRHFSDKAQMRQKIVSFSLSSPMPQIQSDSNC